MATSPLFGWEEPDDTDLVKDGAAAIRTLGNAIDTSMGDLLGGTTGQILSKTSNTNMDFTWITNDVGDITAVNVTSPITGGGSSGAVTIAIQDGTTAQKGAVQLENSTSSTSTTTAAVPASVKSAYDLADGAIAKTTVTTAGDIIYRNSTVPVRLGIGTAGQILTVNSGATAPEWKTPGGAAVTFSGADAKGTGGTQSISNATHTAITFAAEEYDTDGFHDTSTNTSRMTIPAGKGGYYQVNGFVSWDDNTTGGRTLLIRKNGSNYLYVELAPSAVLPSQVISAIVKVVATDYLELFVYQTSGTSRSVTKTAEQSRFNIGFLGA